MVSLVRTVDLVKKVFPTGDKKLEVLLAIETLRSQLKQPLTLSIMSILVFLNFSVKSIIYKLKLLVYFNTPEWYVDIVFVSIVFSFMFGVPFKDIMKALAEAWKARK